MPLNLIFFTESALPLTAATSIRLVRPSCQRLVSENQQAVVYHALQNTRGYREQEEQAVEFGNDFGVC